MIEKIVLSGNDWYLTKLTENEFYGRSGLNKVFNDKREIFSANVPGNVHLDLLKAGKIPDPFYGNNNETCKWISDNYWMYKKKFKIPSDWLKKDVFLKFKRIDYTGLFYLNKKYLGSNLGMFSPTIFKINSLISEKPEDQELFVLLKGAPKERRYAVKCQMSYGWDFAPNIQTIGIWDDVELFTVNGGRIIDYFIYYEISKIKKNLGKDVLLTVKLDYESLNSIKNILIEIEIPELNFSKEVNKEIHDDVNAIEIKSLKIEEVELWYPNASGEQKLYSLNIKIFDSQKSDLIDKIENIKIGFRTIKMKFNPKTPNGNEKWTFLINNRPEFIRGANWVPPDSLFGRISTDTYLSLIKLAKDVNINMFRVWGGGICEKESFYDLCDQFGIMLWQEFPFACSNYPNDQVFLKLVEKECSSIIRQIRNHPSLIIYAGGNEWSPKYNRHLVNTLKKCVSLDPTRKFYNVSPFKGDLHNWAVWHVKQDFNAYKVGHRKNVNKYQFLSEFGLQSPPNIETIKAVIPKERIWPLSEDWKYHRAQLKKLKRYAECVCASKNLKSYIYGSQLAQAEGLKVGIEHVRKMKPEMSGVLFWQFNEPWPAICWSIIDYYKRPKLAYDYLKEIYNPILPIIEYEISKDESFIYLDVYVVNDLHQNFLSCEISVEMNLKNDSKKIFSKKFDLKKESKLQLTENRIKFDLPKTLSLKDKFKLNIKAKICNNKEILLSENNYFPFKYRERKYSPRLHEISVWFVDSFNQRFYWIYELNRYLGKGL